MEKNFTHVYIAKIPEEIGDLSAIYPESRRRYIESAKCVDIKRARYCVWRLLGTALKRSLGEDIKSLDFTVEAGRWSTSLCHISLSHGGGYAAVALSSAPVGVDIEAMKEVRAENFAKRILTPRELVKYESIAESARDDCIIKTWSKKEAIFKSLGLDAFIPQKIDTGAYLCEARVLSYPVGELILAIAHGEGAALKVYENVEI